jgi:hypothetical protein
MTSQVPIAQNRDIFRGRTKNPSAEREQTDDHLFGGKNRARMGAEGGKKAINAHDRFNTVKTTLSSLRVDH